MSLWEKPRPQRRAQPALRTREMGPRGRTGTGWSSTQAAAQISPCVHTPVCLVQHQHCKVLKANALHVHAHTKAHGSGMNHRMLECACILQPLLHLTPYRGSPSGPHCTLFFPSPTACHKLQTCVLRKWSMRRPGVATTISGLRLSTAACTCTLRPPTMSAALMSVNWASLVIIECTCTKNHKEVLLSLATSVIGAQCLLARGQSPVAWPGGPGQASLYHLCSQPSYTSKPACSPCPFACLDSTHLNCQLTGRCEHQHIGGCDLRPCRHLQNREGMSVGWGILGPATMHMCTHACMPANMQAPPMCETGTAQRPLTVLGRWSRRSRIGNANAAVLPLPVTAEPQMSRPARARGTTAACMGVHGCLG